VGLKSRLLDRQLSLNLAGYLYKYRGLQVGVSIADATGRPVIQTVNAAGAKVYGVDFDFSFVPNTVDGLTIAGAVNWNKARFTNFRDAQCYRGQTIDDGCNSNIDPATGYFTGQDLTGNPLVRAPEWQINGSIDYELPVGETTAIRLGLAAQYSSKFLRVLGDRPDFYQPAYATMDANVALVGEDGSWEVALLGRNITDKITSGNCTPSNWEDAAFFPTQITGGATRGPAGVSEVSCVPRKGRELWLRLTVKR
jgi:outer membrane receptor protein involved in Fe transport